MLKNWFKLINWNNYYQVVLFTAIIVAFFGLCRTSEFAANNQSVRFSKSDVHSYRALWLSNISFKLDKQGCIKYCKLNIRSSKIDVFKQSVEIVLGRMKSPVCPVTIISKMLSLRLTLSKTNRRVKLEYFMPLFCLSNGKIVTKRNINKFLKGLVTISGLNVKLYKPYSLRIGGATYLAQRGVPEYTIKMLGRWNSQAYRSYICYDDNYRAKVWSNADTVAPNTNIIFDHSSDDPDL